MKLFPVAFLLLVCGAALPAVAGPGDVYVPAHRTADGLWVPANVPPSSGGTRMAKKPARATKATATTTPSTSTASPAMPPLFVAAEPIRR